MFTGIIQNIGVVRARQAHALELSAGLRARPGDSVAVNGACLTVVSAPRGGRLRFEVSDETWRLTNLGSLSTGESVNLEPALRAGDSLGGHLVTGHVDARAKILQVRPLDEGFTRLRVELPAALRGLVALKGSIAVDGISLTVTAVSRRWLETVLVPYTLTHTNLQRRKPGDAVNLEADLIARYVQSSLAGASR